MQKALNADTQIGAGAVSVRAGTTTINITHYASGAGTVTVKDVSSGASFTVQVGETVTLAWGWSNKAFTITVTGVSTARVLYYF